MYDFQSIKKKNKFVWAGFVEFVNQKELFVSLIITCVLCHLIHEQTC